MTGEDTRKERKGLWSAEDINGIGVIKTYTPTYHRSSLIRRLLHYLAYTFISLIAGLRANKPDLVLTASTPMFAVPTGFLLSKFHRAYFVLDERDLYPDVAVSLGYLRSKLLIKFLERWQNFFRDKAKSLIASTPGIKRILVDKGFCEKKIFVFPNAFYEETPETKLSNVSLEYNELKKYGWDSKFIILYAGSLGQANYITPIIESARLVQNKHEDTSFIFIGEGEKKTNYRDFCTASKIYNCYFMPAQPRERMSNFIERADICVLSFRKDDYWKCAFPNKVFHYLFSSRPVIFAGEGDTSELIQDAKAGIVVEPDDPVALAEAILFLYENPDMGKRMGENGRKYVMTHFSRQKLAQMLAEAISFLDNRHTANGTNKIIGEVRSF